LYICLIILGSRRRATDGLHAPQRPFLCRAHTRSTTYNIIYVHIERSAHCVATAATWPQTRPFSRATPPTPPPEGSLDTPYIYHHHLSRSAQANLTTWRAFRGPPAVFAHTHPAWTLAVVQYYVYTKIFRGLKRIILKNLITLNKIAKSILPAIM